MEQKLHEYVLVEDALELLNRVQNLQTRFHRAVHGLNEVQRIRLAKQREMATAKIAVSELLENLRELDSYFLKEEIIEEEQVRRHAGRPPKTHAEAMKALKKNIKHMEKQLKI